MNRTFGFGVFHQIIIDLIPISGERFPALVASAPAPSSPELSVLKSDVRHSAAFFGSFYRLAYEGDARNFKADQSAGSPLPISGRKSVGITRPTSRYARLCRHEHERKSRRFRLYVKAILRL